MSRHQEHFVLHTLLTIVSLFVGATAHLEAAEKGETDSRPNILFIAVDDLNDWLGCMNGHPQVKTPNFDRLAARGVLFTQAHCVAPACGPSRTAIFSGQRPATTLMYSNADKAGKHLDGRETLPQCLAKHGYHTMGGGKLLHGGSSGHFDEIGPSYVKFSPFTNEQIKAAAGQPGPWAMDRGPDRPDVFLPLSGMPNDRKPGTLDTFDWGSVDCDEEEMSDLCLADWAAERLRSKHDKPFFLGVGFFRVHQPLYAPTEYFDLYPRDSIILPEVPEDDLDDLGTVGREFGIQAITSGLHSSVVKTNNWEDAVRAYLACITLVDEGLGRVLDALDAGPHADNTMILLWSDHGWQLGEKEHWGKWTGWTRSTRVPFMIVPPADSQPDGFKPGRECPRPVTLLDLYPTITDACQITPDAAIEGRSLMPLIASPDAAWDPVALTTFGRGNYSVHGERWHYIRYFDGSDELYDHQTDPNEWRNLAAEPEHEAIKRRLAAHLPEDSHVAHYVRMGDWKAVIPTSGEPLLFTGLQGGKNLAEANPDVLATILRYVEEDLTLGKHVVIVE